MSQGTPIGSASLFDPLQMVLLARNGHIFDEHQFRNAFASQPGHGFILVPFPSSWTAMTNHRLGFAITALLSPSTCERLRWDDYFRSSLWR